MSKGEYFVGKRLWASSTTFLGYCNAVLSCYEIIWQYEILCPFLFHKKRTKRKSPCDKSLTVRVCGYTHATLLWVVSQGKKLFDRIVFAECENRYRDPTPRAACGAVVQGVTRVFLVRGMFFCYFSANQKSRELF